MQKLKTYKKYSTLSQQPRTPWGHTRGHLETIVGWYTWGGKYTCGTR